MSDQAGKSMRILKKQRRPAVEAGLAIFEEGGDFTDGLIAYEGRWLGGEVFVFFDKKAVALIARQGQQTQLLG